MDRKYLTMGPVEISYREENRSASKTIFFFHGNSGSSLHWTCQLQSGIFSKYRLIAFDLPGHGESSGIPSGDYSVTNIAAIMAQSVKALGRENAYALVGFSFGGNVVAEMLAHAIAPQAIVLLSTGLVGKEVALEKVVQSGLVIEILFHESPKDERLHEYFNALPRVENPKLVATLLDDYRKTNKAFRPGFLRSIEAGIYSDEISLLRNWHGEPLVVYGRQDKIVNPDLLDDVSLPFWRREIVKVNHAAHLVNMDQPVLIDALLHDYFQDCL